MSGLPQGGFRRYGRPGRRRVIFAGAILIVFLVAWSVVVLSWGGGSPDRSGTPRERAGEARGPEREAVPEEPAYAQGEAGSGADGDAGGGAPAGEGSSGDRPATPTGQDAQASPEPQRSEPEGYRPDPLGTGASAGGLAPVDEERVGFAAARFVTAAYGYSGDDKDAYNQEVGSTVAWPVFYESPGSKEIGRYAARVGESGTRSAALLTRFERTGGGPTTATGYAHFETGEGYGSDGELTGRRLSYRQEMTLVRSGGAWVVKSADTIEET